LQLGNCFNKHLQSIIITGFINKWINLNEKSF
jgi:hypothetical protein